MGLLDKLVQPVKSLFSKPTQEYVTGYRTFTEHSPAFSSWDGNLYGQLQIRAIVERIATACSKLKPEFVTPEGSGGSIPRVQRLFSTWPNDMQTWPDFLRLVSTRLFMDNVAYVVPGYDARDRSIVALYPLKPQYAEVVEYDGEPWWRFHLYTGEIQAFPFYDVAVLTRFQFESDIFGSGNEPLNPTLRLMDAQRQAEEIALKTSADIRFIGKLSGLMHEKHIQEKRDLFSEANLGRDNTSGLLLYDQTFESIEQLKTDNHYVIDPDEMKRIDKALYAYFGINEKILNAEFDEQVWNAFYESTIEPVALMLGERLSLMLLSPTQVRKGNRIMFSSSYLEYASIDSKIKAANLLTTTGTGMRNEVRDIFQLPRDPNGDVYMVRGEYYVMDRDNNIIAESGGRTDHDGSWHDDLSDLDEPDEPDLDEVSRAINARISKMIESRLSEVEA